MATIKHLDESYNTQETQESKMRIKTEPDENIYATIKKIQKKKEIKTEDAMRIFGAMEAELQARDVVIATLKAERVKRLLTGANGGRVAGTVSVASKDPRIALLRDDNLEKRESEAFTTFDRQRAALNAYVHQHRLMISHMARLLKEMEMRHAKVIQELEEEKRKHEHDTAQGDDITYGLEKERTRLKQELEMEKAGRKKAEKDLIKFMEIFDEEKAKTKSIVFLLIAERKKALIKLVEERKRSEDLVLILHEEKDKVESMAVGLEEESKKSLQMEAELERQIAEFDTERQQLKTAIVKEEKRCKELEIEAERFKNEAENLKKQLVEAHQVAMFQAGTGMCPRPPHPPAKPSIASATLPPKSTVSQGLVGQSKLNWPGATTGVDSAGSASPPSSAMLSSVAKVVQPTATVSSVPVSGPTTGIARSVSPGQTVRSNFTCPTTGTNNRSWQEQEQQQALTNQAQVATGVTSRSGGANVLASSASPSPIVLSATNKAITSSTNVDGSKFGFRVPSVVAASGGDTSQMTVKKAAPGSRGYPPPIPPNKPVVPPKKDNIRRPEPDGKVPATSVAVSGSTPALAPATVPSMADASNIKFKVGHCPEVLDEDTQTARAGNMFVDAASV